MFFTAGEGEFVFESAVIDGEVILNGVVALEVFGVAGPEGFHQAVAVFITGADAADFAFGDEVVECFEGVFCAHAVIGPVDLVEVDVVGLESAKAAFEGFADVVAIKGGFPSSDGWVEPAVCGSCYLGGYNEAVSVFVLHPFSEPCFGEAGLVDCGWHWVDLGGINEVDTSVGGTVKDAEAFLLITLFAEGHGAEAYFTDDDSAAA